MQDLNLQVEQELGEAVEELELRQCELEELTLRNQELEQAVLKAEGQLNALTTVDKIDQVMRSQGLA